MLGKNLAVRSRAVGDNESVRSPLAAMLDLEFAEMSDCGRLRTGNEDFIGRVVPASEAQARTRGWLFALADGVGGNNAGEVASRTAVEAIAAGFRSAANGEAYTTLLPKLVQAANTRVHECGLASPANAGMASTVVACAVRFDRAVIAHVGDSRCYLVRGHRVTALTRDHTVANEQARIGVLSSREAERAATRHVLSRSLGGDLFVNVDCSEHHLHAGDHLLLCSDGLHGSLDTAELPAILARSSSLDEAAERLISIANERDGSDNISVQLVRIRSVERVGMYRGRPYTIR